MNKKILQKVIDELTKPKPNLSYIKGILETLMENFPEEKVQSAIIQTVKTPNNIAKPNTSDDPVIALEAKAMQFLNTQNKDPRNTTSITVE